MIIILFLYGGIRNTIQTYIDSQTSKTFKEKYGIIRGMGSVGFLLTTFFIGMYYSDSLLQYFVYFITISSIIIGLSMGLKYKDIDFKEEAFDFSIITSNKLYWSFILVYHISLGLLFSFLSIYLIDKGFEISQIGNAWNISVLAEIIMLFTFVLIANKLSINNFIILAILMTMVRFVLLYMYPENYMIVLGAQILHLFTFPIFHINTMKTIEKLFPNNMKMGLKSYFAIGYGLSLAIGSFLGSYLYGENLFLYVTGITFISLILWLFFIKRENII
jgi:PPP family 3-phenylpropionic acid transporter